MMILLMLSVSESDEEVSLDTFVGMSQQRIANMDEVKSAVMKPVGEVLLEVDGVKFTRGGDSVVDSINVDVNVAEPGPRSGCCRGYETSCYSKVRFGKA